MWVDSFKCAAQTCHGYQLYVMFTLSLWAFSALASTLLVELSGKF